MMATGSKICLLFAFVASTCAFSLSSNAPQGRKLFGGYRIVPKPCQPTIQSQMKSSEPAICMFNYECTRRNGEVVGACMDGFLFGACCQLPPRSTLNDPLEKVPSHEDLFILEEPDHAPDIPILLNEDGTPLGMAKPQSGNNIKTDSSSGLSNHLNDEETTYTKISTFEPHSKPEAASSTPLSHSHNSDQQENAEKPQIPPLQPDISHLEEDFSAILGHQDILDDLNLPALLSHSDSNNDIQVQHQQQDPSAVNPVTTLLSPDQILQIADPVDQLPALFSQGLSHNNHSAADTILLNENGTLLDEKYNPDELFKPSTEADVAASTLNLKERTKFTEATQSTESLEVTKKVNESSSSSSSSTPTHWVKFTDQPSSTTTTTTTTQMTPTSYSDTKISSASKVVPMTQAYGTTQKPVSVLPTSQYTVMADTFEKVNVTEEKVANEDIKVASATNNKEETTTPMSASTKDKDMVKVPTITYDVQSGNKKDDILDNEEIAINHIISILNDSTPGVETTVTVQAPTSSIHNAWLNDEETSKSTVVKLSSTKATFKPSSSLQPSTWRPSTLQPSSTLKTSTPKTTATSTATQSPAVFYKPAQPSTYYNYETVATETNYPFHSTSNAYSSKPSTPTSFGSSNSFAYSSRPTTNPPAPTVIVLGPLGTEFTTETTEKTLITKRPAPTAGSSKPTFVPAKLTPSENTKPVSVSTKKPSVSTMITHNISTVISNVATSNNHVVSTSYITVNLKEGVSTKSPESLDDSTEAFVPETSVEERITTTSRPTVWTAVTWSNKPAFYLKPSTPNVDSPQTSMSASTIVLKGTTAKPATATVASIAPCDEETPSPNDFVNFPPVRNPNLNISTPILQQEKPTIVETFNNTGYPNIEVISENDIPTPSFVEDAVLTNKVDAFVNKIVESLQSNFQDLKDVVYNRPNSSTPSTSPTTRRPITANSTTKKPPRKPAQSSSRPPQATTKRPTLSTRRPTTRPTTLKPSSVGKPQTVKPTTSKPRPSAGGTSAATTKKPQVTTKRPKPTRKQPTTTTETAAVEEEVTSSIATTETSAVSSETTSATDLRRQCGVRPLIRSGKIVGGKGATFGAWPWQVLVREATWLGLFTKNKCGGVLITDKYVITAAHCQPGFLASLVAVFGEFDISGDRESKRSVTKNVRRVIVNRGYDPATFENDLALLELESPVQFDSHIVPICMPDDNADFTGRKATVTGWGRLKYNGGVPSILQEVQVPIMENSVCQEMFHSAGHSKLILESFLCAGYSNGQKDSCEGDSGGPLVIEQDGRWVLVGTVSHGIKCAAPYLPGVYMRTTYFKPWLHSITGV